MKLAQMHPQVVWSVLVGHSTCWLKYERMRLPRKDRIAAKVKMKTASHAFKYSDVLSLAPIMTVPTSPLAGDIGPGPTCQALHVRKRADLADNAIESVVASTRV